MSAMDLSVPSINETTTVPFGGKTALIITGDEKTTLYLIKKSAVIGISVNTDEMRIYIKHFEGNYIRLPITPQTTKKLLAQAEKVLMG